MGRAPRFSIILAGGKGTRMRSADRHKVCFHIDGQPAINRALDVYKGCGIAHHIVVVGAMAGQVIETVGQEHEGILFAYQAEQLGTAHATRQGAKVLEALGAEVEVLIVAGDRVVEPSVVEQLFDRFYGQGCDMAFLVGPRRRRSDPGCVIVDVDGTVLGNVEVRDVWQRAAYRALREAAAAGAPLPAALVEHHMREHFDDRRGPIAFGELWHAAVEEGRDLSADEIRNWIPEHRTRFSFRTPGGDERILSPAEVDRTPLANYSTYLVKTAALRDALDRLDRDNAQHEEYLSDMITLLAQARDGDRPRYRVEALRVDDPNHVMAFNDPAELLEIEAYIQARVQQAMRELPETPAFRTVAAWRAALAGLLSAGRDAGAELWDEFVATYGEDVGLIEERARAYLALLEAAAERLETEARVLIVRSPGRLNAMGRHVDHQGGHCNLMTIGYETLIAVHPRQDDQVKLHNVDSARFPDRAFSIGSLLADLPWDDWLSLVNSDKVCDMVVQAGGDWAQYVKAAVVRLQKKFSTAKLRGVDMIVHGDIPIAAGLSSSSALVVATAEAMIVVNALDTFPAQFVDLCGEGEWFVGTRGGSADHAAIKYGQRGKVVKVTFFDFAVEEVVPFPSEYAMVVCDSGVVAQKTANARDQFNHRVSCYRIGLQLIKALNPQYAPLLGHLRDVNVRSLRIPLSWIYKILLRLPEQATRDELRAMLPGVDLEPHFATHALPDDGLYPIRGVVLYGLAECERSRRYADALKSGRIDEIGRLMNASHDGDRVSYLAADGTRQPYWAPTSNGYLLDLIEDLESEDPARVVRAQLEWQPGSYHCSVPEIDHMVDLAQETEGVAGAQLAGAGLGGCMMVLVRSSALPRLEQGLAEAYYAPRGKRPAILVCTPIAGSSVLLGNGR